MTGTEPLVTLGEVLLAAERLPNRMELFLPRDAPWHAGTVGALLDPEEYDDDEDPDHPRFAQERRLSLTLGVSQIQEVVWNARAQDPSAGVERLVEAFTFYFQHDAFYRLWRGLNDCRIKP